MSSVLIKTPCIKCMDTFEIPEGGFCPSCGTRATRLPDHDFSALVASSSSPTMRLGGLGRAVDLPTQVVVPRREPVASDAVVNGLTRLAIYGAYEELHEESGQRPTKTRVAERLGMSESTLYRTMRKLGMGRWPPSQPKRAS